MSYQDEAPFNWVLWLLWIFTTTLGWLIGSTFLPPAYGVGVTIGFAQWLVLRPLFPKTGWWILATAAGWTLGWGVIFITTPPQIETIIGAVLGAITGFAQWFILKNWVPKAGWWVIVSSLGWAIGLSGFVDFPYVGVLVGVITGIGIELMIRYSK
ncbi:MAG: hypothetical protein ISS57_12510 [Anaerolineales bacterium]|nr:hypothetical protein [Anaerolineales bacterium]